MLPIARSGVVLAAAALVVVAVPTVTRAESVPRGRLVVCNHASYIHKVYADGPSSRQEDLAGESDECTHWRPVLPGRYSVGYVARIPSNKNLVFSARVKHGDKLFYKKVKPFGYGVAVHVTPGEVTRIDWFVRRA